MLQNILRWINSVTINLKGGKGAGEEWWGGTTQEQRFLYLWERAVL